jgi:LysR family transcriptional activator of nhaA
MEWLNYHHLRYFWTVARKGGMRKAADAARFRRARRHFC